jgi:hypothetical protein
LLPFSSGYFFFCLQPEKVKIKIYKTVILPVLYGCEAWSVTLRKELGLSMFENRVLRILGPEGEEVMGGWRRLHSEGLHNLYASSNIYRMTKSRRRRLAGNVACMGRVKNSYKILNRKSEGKRPCGRRRCRWKDNYYTQHMHHVMEHNLCSYLYNSLVFP